MPKKSRKKGQNVKIYARVRPLMPWEPKECSLTEHGNKLRNKTTKTENEYSFAKVFGQKDTNEYMFKCIVEPMIDNVLNGFNAVLIAYGQTGSGKTYSMLGKPHLKVVGLLPYMLKSVVEAPNVKKLELLAVEAFGHHVARIELFDLFDKKNQTFVWADKHGDTGLEPHKALKVQIRNIDEAYEKIKYAHRGSHFAPTGKNPESSRGHVTFIAKVIQSPPNDPTSEQTSYFIMLDCAGSEGESAFTKEFIKSVDKTTLMARRLEAGCINTGLSQLQIIFNELRTKGSLAKMVGNGLRRVLHPYINTKTFLAVLFTFSPAKNNAKSTESTLKFAVTAGMVKVNPVKAEITTNLEALVKQLRKQIEENEKKMEEQADRLTEVQNEFEKIKQEALNIKDLEDFDFQEEEENDDDDEYVEEEVIDENGNKKTVKKLKPKKVKMNNHLLSELDEFDNLDEGGFDLGNDFKTTIKVDEDIEKEMEKAIKKQEQTNKGGDLIKSVIDVDDKDKNKTFKAMKQLESTLQNVNMDVTLDDEEREEQRKQKIVYNYLEKNEEEIKGHIDETWQEIDVVKEEQTKLKKQQNNVVDHLTETNEWLFSTLSEVLSE